ncbi:MAG: cell division protein SepF [Nanoarchaeota archaeon]|nr:cell division protein SepF [Nanoarchaeota archaeon]
MGLNIKKFFGGSQSEEDYVEIDLDSMEPKQNKVLVRPFVLRNFDDITEILNSLRDGYTIAVIDIKPLKAKDIIELKRSIAKIKKTIEALEGSIAGFGDNIIIATPSFAKIHREQQEPKKDRADFINE